MRTGGNTTGNAGGRTVLIALVVPLGATTHAMANGGTKTSPAATPQSAQQRVADAMRKAAQSSPAAKAAFQRNPAAAAKIGAHAQTLAANPARSPLAALKQGLGVSAGLHSLRKDMRKDFREGGGQVKTKSTHGLTERGQRHAAAAERGLRRGGLGLLSAAWHGTQIMREQRKTLNRERAEARAEARATGKPAPPEGVRALLGSAVKGVGIARGLRAGLSEMRTQTRAQRRTGADAVDRRAVLAVGIRTQGQDQAPDAMQTQARSGAPRVLHATGFALGVMARRGGGSQGTSQAALGLLLMRPGPMHDEEAEA